MNPANSNSIYFFNPKTTQLLINKLKQNKSFTQFQIQSHEMDLSDIAQRLGLSESKQLIRKAAEFRRLCDAQFDSSVIGVVSTIKLWFIHQNFKQKLKFCLNIFYYPFQGEICKAIMCLEIAATRYKR